MGGSRPGSHPKVSDARRILEWLTTTTFEVRPDRRSFSLQPDPAARASRPLRTMQNHSKPRQTSSTTMKSRLPSRRNLRGSHPARSPSNGLPSRRHPRWQSPSRKPPRRSLANQWLRQSQNQNQSQSQFPRRQQPSQLRLPFHLRPAFRLRLPFRRVRRTGRPRCSASPPRLPRSSRSSPRRIPLHRARHPSPHQAGRFPRRAHPRRPRHRRRSSARRSPPIPRH
jgi:hypothetical protein